MSRSGNIWDNAAMESFFSSLKIERTTRKTYHARNEAKADVFDSAVWMLSDEDWRKRVGVEPTKSRLATLSGFEGQPPHRERFPSAGDNGGSAESCHRRTQFRRQPASKPGRKSLRQQPEEKKMHASFTKIATVAFASLVLAAGAAAAQEMRKDQVQDRVHDTNQRINQEYREGNISRGQAREDRKSVVEG